MGFSLASVHDADLEGEAVQIAERADLAIVFTGHDPQWETEGRDQDSFHLPRQGSQDRLVTAVAKANRNTIVVNSTGVAVAMPWLDQVPALLQTWFPGQECGNAIADVLTGAVNPEGRLPVSFPKRIEDAPAYGNFPGEYIQGQLKVQYAEGVFVGYRHFDRLARDKVNFPFGYGLSYTSFSIGEMKVTKEAEEPYAVSVMTQNTGSQTGGVVVQVYAGRSEKSADHPIKTLVAFQKVRLDPGEQKAIQLHVSIRDLAYFDESKHCWLVDAGQYEVSTGTSSMDIVQALPITIQKQMTYRV